MQIIQNINSTSFNFNGLKFMKNFIVIKQGNSNVAIHNYFDTRFQLMASTPVNQVKVNGVIYANQTALMAVLAPLLFVKEGGNGGEVDSVNGQVGVVVLDKNSIGLDNVDNTKDIDKPISNPTLNAILFKNGTGSSSIKSKYSDNIASGQYSFGVGFDVKAQGQISFAEGDRTQAFGTSSHAEGILTKAIGDGSHAEGANTEAKGVTSHAGGYKSIASGNTSFVHGYNSNANGDYSIVLGRNLTGNTADTTYVDKFNIKNLHTGISVTNLGINAQGFIVSGITGGTDIRVTGGTYSNGTAVFTNNTGGTFNVSGFLTGVTQYWSAGTGTNAIATINGDNVASGNFSLAEGYNTIASGQTSHAEGRQTQSLGVSSHAEGQYSKAVGGYSHAEGYFTQANGHSTHSEGFETLAFGDYSHSQGYYTQAIGESSHSEGNRTTANNFYSHAEGTETIASGISAHAEGNQTIAGGNYSHAQGTSTQAIGDSAHSEGQLTIASGNSSHAEGHQTQANSDGAHSEGIQTKANGYASHSEGQSTIASGNSAHAEGVQTIAGGYSSHSEGTQTQALGNQSHAQGFNTIASGLVSHVGGSNSQANGSHSFAHGNTVKANGIGSIVLGYNSVASTDYTVVLGREITGSTPDTTYVDKLNIKRLPIGGVLVNNLGIDSTGNVVVGTTGGSGGGSNYWVAGAGADSIVNNNGTNSATGTTAFAMGVNNVAGGNNSTAFGNGAKALGNNSFAQGTNVTASTQNSFAQGNGAQATGLYSFASGVNTKAQGINSVAFGNNTKSNGIASLAGGVNTTTVGNYSIVWGSGSSVVANSSYVFGNGITANVDNTTYVDNLNVRSFPSSSVSNNLGVDYLGNIVIGELPLWSASTGVGSIVTKNSGCYASGDYTLAFGNGSWASGLYSTAGGYVSKASGDYSFVFGNNSFANGENSIVFGKDIIGDTADTTYVDRFNIKTIGSGTSISNLGIDATGNIVSGSTGSAGGSSGISNSSPIGVLPITIDGLGNMSGSNVTILEDKTAVFGDLSQESIILDQGFETGSISPLTSTGVTPWFIQTDITNNGNYALRSGAIGGDSQTDANYSFTPAHNCYLSFSYFVYAENGYDYFRFLVNGDEVFKTSHTYGDWSNYTYHFNAGQSYDVIFRYSKDSGGSNGFDAVVIDDLKIIQPEIYDGSDIKTRKVFGQGFSFKDANEYQTFESGTNGSLTLNRQINDSSTALDVFAYGDGMSISTQGTPLKIQGSGNKGIDLYLSNSVFGNQRGLMINSRAQSSDSYAQEIIHIRQGNGLRINSFGTGIPFQVTDDDIVKARILNNGVFEGSAFVTTAVAPTQGVTSGVTGQIIATSDYIYVCAGGTTWTRATLTSF